MQNRWFIWCGVNAVVWLSCQGDPIPRETYRDLSPIYSDDAVQVERDIAKIYDQEERDLKLLDEAKKHVDLFDEEKKDLDLVDEEEKKDADMFDEEKKDVNQHDVEEKDMDLFDEKKDLQLYGEKGNTKRSYAEEIFLTSMDGEREIDSLKHPEKRIAILAAAAAVAPLASIVFGAGSFTYGIVNGQMRLAELKKINKKLDDIDKKISQLQHQVGALRVGQQWLEGAVLYGKDVQRLQWFLHQLTAKLRLQNDKSLGPAGEATAWANAVLSSGADGMSQVLYNYHEMMVGTNHFFGRTPLFVIYESMLDVDSDQYWSQVKSIITLMYSTQLAGYAAWITALNVKGKHSEVAYIKSMGKKRIDAQMKVLNPLTLGWPKGTYGLPKTNTGCPVAAEATWHSSWRRHDTEDDDASNQWSNPLHFPGGYGTNNMVQHFCMKLNAGQGEGNWPRGNYCIFKRGSCPSGFSQGRLYWDDEDDDNGNSHSGHLPDGTYNSNTAVEYCCRRDGSSSSQISLPNRAPFYLFRHTSSCQKVKNTNVREEFFRWDDEDDDNGNSKSGSHPYDDGGNNNHRIHYCYYTKTN